MVTTKPRTTVQTLVVCRKPKGFRVGVVTVEEGLVPDQNGQLWCEHSASGAEEHLVEQFRTFVRHAISGMEAGQMVSIRLAVAESPPKVSDKFLAWFKAQDRKRETGSA